LVARYTKNISRHFVKMLFILVLVLALTASGARADCVFYEDCGVNPDNGKPLSCKYEGPPGQ
jgi:hypothetical protein